MKKLVGALLCAALAAGSFTAFAQENTEAEKKAAAAEEFSFGELDDLVFYYSSGVGGWFVELNVAPDGSFKGNYHDSEMGESADEYPNGTVYGCLFHGQLEAGGMLDSGAVELTVASVEMDEGQLDEVIEDGIRYVTVAPAGLKAGESLELFRPGYPVEELPEGYLFWSHLNMLDEKPEELPFYGIYNAAEDSGFTGEQKYTGLANPWSETDENGFMQTVGISLNLPEGAEDVSWRVLKENGLGELIFTLDGQEYTARVCSSGVWEDISGLFYNQWDSEESCKVDYCEGTLRSVKDESMGYTVCSCLWFDVVPGFMYSVTAEAEDPAGADVLRVAEAVFVPAQGDS